MVVPWAAALAEFKLSGPPRLRRDISNLLALSRAHAVLHRATREVDERGRIIATIDDYDVVRDILSDRARRRHRQGGPEGHAGDRGRRRGTAGRRQGTGVDAGRFPEVGPVSIDDPHRRTRRARARLSDQPFAAGEPVRPRRRRRAAGPGRPAPRDPRARPSVRPVFAECSVPDRTRKPASQSQKPASVRSVRSNPDRAGEETYGAAWDRVLRERAEPKTDGGGR